MFHRLAIESHVCQAVLLGDEARRLVPRVQTLLETCDSGELHVAFMDEKGRGPALSWAQGIHAVCGKTSLWIKNTIISLPDVDHICRYYWQWSACMVEGRRRLRFQVSEGEPAQFKCPLCYAAESEHRDGVLTQFAHMCAPTYRIDLRSDTEESPWGDDIPMHQRVRAVT